jgi:hypothetical protein
MDILYLRFGEIPKNEISGIFRGDLGRIGDECGVSCWEGIKIGDNYKLILPQIESCGMNYTMEGMMEDLELGNKKVYIITGDFVGYGSHGEPCLKNVKIIKELKLINKQLKTKL